MTLDSELENEKFANQGVSLYMSEWPEKGNMRRRWTFQRMGHPEDAVKIDDTGSGRVVTTAAGKSAAEKSTKSRKRQLPRSKEKKKSGDTVMVEPEDKSSPLSAMEQDGSGKAVSVKKKRSPLATRNKQARIEAEERREYREESNKEKQKKTKNDSTPKQSPPSQKIKSEKCSQKTMARKKSSTIISQPETSTKAPKKAIAPKNETSSGCHIEQKVDRLTELVESLIVKVDNLQKTLSDEQRIRASKDPRLAELLTRAEQTADNLNSHYQDLVFLDNFPKEKKDDLKKMADDIRRLNNQR